MRMSRLFWMGLGGMIVMQGWFAAYAEDRWSLFDDSVSFGGEIRSRGEVYGNFYSPDGTADRDDEFGLLRSRLHMDVHPYEAWSFYIEAQDARQFGGDLINRHTVSNLFEDDLDLFQGYLDLHHIFDSPVSLRVGRQILAYGTRRLIGDFNWSNTARSFDAVKLMLDLESLGGQVDFFVGQEVMHAWGRFNDTSDRQPGFADDNTLYGLYSTWKQIPYVDFLEAYYLLKDNNNAGHEVHTLGVRSGRQYDSGWDWDIEMAGQFGEFAHQDHQAFASHIEMGYTFDYACQPRVALGYNYATGDDAGDGDHETFDNLFPTNHIHYGGMDLFSWRNMHNIELELSAKPCKTITAVSELHMFLLDEPGSDFWYSAGGAPLRLAAPGTNPDSYVGTEIDLRLQYKPCAWFIVEGGYSHFFAGSYVDDTGEGEDADWGYLMTTVTF